MQIKCIAPQALSAYGIRDVSEIVYNPSYEVLFRKRSLPTWRDMNAAEKPSWALSPSTPGFLPVVRPKINISFVMTPRVNTCGGRIKAKARTITTP